jgi:RNA-directed DNA polymerase
MSRRDFYRRLFDIHGGPTIRGLLDLSAHSCVPVRTLRELIRDNHNAYTTFNIRKKSGGYRAISNPISALKRTQRWILRQILDRLKTTSACYGFAPRSNLRDHAKQHLNARAVLTLDIENFFPSISIAQVVRVFRAAGYSSTGAWILARLCTLDGALPQGAPSSPSLANLVCFRMDRRLDEFARCRGFTYTRYADDLTFSSNSMGLLAKSRPFIAHIINDSGFRLNQRKTRLVGPRGRRRVTGLVLAQAQIESGRLIAPAQVGIGRRRLRELRARIHNAQIGDDDLSAIQGWLDLVSDIDPKRYQMLVRYVSGLLAQAPSPLVQLRLRP